MIYLHHSVAGGKAFSKLDLAHAYQQVPLDKQARKYVTINKQKGLFQYTRLPFGVSSATAIFKNHGQFVTSYSSSMYIP